ALAVSDFLQIPFAVYQSALASFGGVGRRFTVRGEQAGVMVVDDYGHHPAEVRATLAGARAGFGRRLGVAFQPPRHTPTPFPPRRYTRTHGLLDEFAVAFHDAAEVLVCDIYPAGEDPIAGVSAARLVDAMRARGHRGARHVPTRADLAAAAVALLQPGDIFL